jgi:DNA-directed RNA polymerase specialized sigma24 family protein
LDEAPSAEDVDSALIAELREIAPIGKLTLNCATCTQVAGVRLNTLRVHLERAIVEIPSTERVLFLLHDVEGYGYDRISRLLGLSVRLCQSGVHQARLRIRELLASMVR